MTLTLADCAEHIRIALAGRADPSTPPQKTVSQTCAWFGKAHQWRFLVRPPKHLNLRGTITASTATWTESTLTLTKVAAFTNYVFLEGDELQITSGTGATADYYQVASRVSADAIKLVSSIGAAANGSADIAFTMQLPAVVLPADFGQIVGHPRSVNLVGDFQPVDYTTLLDLRSWSPVGSSPFYYYCITDGESTNVRGGAPVPRLELDRPPVSDSTGAIWILYRAKLTPPQDDLDRIRIPDYCEAAFIRAVRCHARGWEEEDSGTLGPRLLELKTSPEWTDAVAGDGGMTDTVGPIRGGAALRYHGFEGWWHRRDVVVSVP